MELGMPKRRYGFVEVHACRIWRFKSWVHYVLFQDYLDPLLPAHLRSKRHKWGHLWLYGPGSDILARIRVPIGK